MTTLGTGYPYHIELISGSEAFLFAADGTITTSLGGQVFNSIVNAGGELIELAGGTAYNTVVNYGGFEEVDSGGHSLYATINSGGIEYVLSSGSEAYATVRGGGLEVVYAGGQTVGDQLLGSGAGTFAEEILSGGTAFYTVISSTGLLIVSAGGVAYGANVDNTNLGLSLNGGLKVVAGGTAYNTQINAGGIENVSAGGRDFDATVNNGGLSVVFAGGVETDATVLSGGLMLVSSGGVASGTEVYASGPTAGEVVQFGGKTFNEKIYFGGAESVRNGGTSVDATVFSGGAQNLGLPTSAGGTAQDTTVMSGGLLRVYSGGVATDATVSAGGLMVVSNGGSAIGTQLYASGFAGEAVSSGGVTHDETIHSGGAESVRHGGTAFNTTVLSGGTLNLGLSSDFAQQLGTTSAGGVAIGATIDAGGHLKIFSEGVASSTIINGLEVVSAGGATTDTHIHGGTLHLLPGGAASGFVSFDGIVGGALTIDDPFSFDQTISGLFKGDVIDLPSLNPQAITVQFDGSTLSVHTFGGDFEYSIVGARSLDFFSIQVDEVSGTKLVFDQTQALTINNRLFDTGTLTTDQIAVEMVKLAVDAYPDPSGSGYHTFTALTPPWGIPPDSYARIDVQKDNWHAVSASELQLSQSGLQGSTQYSFVNGYYQAINSSDALGSDPSEADAIVLTGLVNGKTTLAISFAGTDQLSDWQDFANFQNHYDKFAPLVMAIKTFVDSNQIDQVFISGHSLGAAMAQYFIEDPIFQNDPKFHAQAWTIGSPGADNASASSDPRITNFIHLLVDPVTDVPVLSSEPLLDKNEFFVTPVAAFLVSKGLDPVEAGLVALQVVNGTQKLREGTDLPVNFTSAESTSLFHDALDYFNDLNSYYGFPLQSKLVDGHVAGATVFADTNGNGKLDPGENSTTTDPNGSFTPVGNAGPLIAMGGTDTSTGLAFKGQLGAPAGSTSITPLTTLVLNLQSHGVPNAEAQVLAAFGLDPSTNLTSLDSIAATLGGNPDGAKVYAAGVEATNTVTMIASALTSAGAITANTSQVFAELANFVANQGQDQLDLTNTDLLGQLIQASAHALLETPDPIFISAVAAIVAASDAALQNDAGGLTGPSMVDAIADIERIAQGPTSDALQRAAGDQTLIPLIVNAFTGSNLTNALALRSNDANHAPWLATDNVASHSIFELAGKTGSNDLDTANGKLLFTDGDLSDTHQVGAVLEQSSIKWMNADGTISSTALPTTTSETLMHAIQAALVHDSTDGSVGELSWSFSAADHYFDFLAAGESLHVTYDVAVTDNQGAKSDEPVTIVINGTNDNLTALPDSNGVAKGSAISVAGPAGVLSNDGDPDMHDHLVVGGVNGLASNVGHVVRGTYGSLTLNANGSYAYTADKGGLPAQTVAQDTFNYSVFDGHGGTSTTALNIVVSNPDVAYLSGVNTTVVGSNGKNVLDGSAGRDVLIGGNGADVLIGGNGDTLTGGPGPDTFLFRPNFGVNVIADFNVNNDELQFNKSIFAGVDDILNHLGAASSGAIINDGHGDTITLIGVTLSQLQAHQNDFHLV